MEQSVCHVTTGFPRVSVVTDPNIVEICGALKNIVACAAGFCDGLKMGDNTKAAIIRLGLQEMIQYGDIFYPGGNHATYFESCGVADLITTCYGGRNRKVSQAFVERKKSIAELEGEMLNGQKLQGPETAAEVGGSFYLDVSLIILSGELRAGGQRSAGPVPAVHCSPQDLCGRPHTGTPHLLPQNPPSSLVTAQSMHFLNVCIFGK